LEWGNNIFTICFSVELITRIIAYKKHFFLGTEWCWNIFDGVIVISAWAELIFSGMAGVSALRALRALRLARTLRIIRVVTIFRNLMLMLNTLMNSLLSLVWMLVLLLLSMYLVTIVFMGAASAHLTEQVNSEQASTLATISGDEMTYEQQVEAFRMSFRTIPRGMLSMFFAVTGGQDWYEIIQPLLAISWTYAVLFVAFEIFVVFGVFNVLNGVFVENVLSNRDKDLLIQNEMNKTEVFMKDMAALFLEGDEDGDSKFTMEELAELCSKPRFTAYLNTHSLDASDAKTLFTILDEDCSGTIDVEEFVLGALKLKGPARCLDVYNLNIKVAKTDAKVDGIAANQAKLV